MPRTIERLVASFMIHFLHSRVLNRLRRPVGRYHAELFGVLRVQPLPAAELHRRGADHAADGSSAEKPIQNIETNVPPGSTHCDEAPIDVVPQCQARAATKVFEFPPHLVCRLLLVKREQPVWSRN